METTELWRAGCDFGFKFGLFTGGMFGFALGLAAATWVAQKIYKL